MNCEGCDQLKARMEQLEARVAQLEAQLRAPDLGFQPRPDPQPIPVRSRWNERPGLSDVNGGVCSQCGHAMSEPRFNPYWNPRLGRHDSREEWICNSCDRGSVKMF